jgi:hypothetical protein
MVTPVIPIVLQSSTGSLTLTAAHEGVGGWCQVQLTQSSESRPLGAERLKYLAMSLVSFLKKDQATTGLRSIFGLSERHTCAYGEHVGEDAVLHLQDADGKMFAKLVITQTEKAQWVQELLQYTNA